MIEKLGFGTNVCNRGTKYYQRAVFVNKSDVGEFLTTVEGGANHISFKLKKNKKGYTISFTERGESIVGSVGMEKVNGIPEYSHKVTFLLNNNSILHKVIARQIDVSNVFVALVD